MKENKIDKLELLKKLQHRESDGMKNVLEERESIISTDMLLDD